MFKTGILGCIDSNISCQNHGACSVDFTQCLCDARYASYRSTNITQCNYERKERSVALVLGIVPLTSLFGFPWWYLEKYSPGAVLVGLWIVFFLSNIYRKANRLEWSIFLILVAVIWILTVALLNDNDLTDGKGVYVYG